MDLEKHPKCYTQDIAALQQKELAELQQPKADDDKETSLMQDKQAHKYMRWIKGGK